MITFRNALLRDLAKERNIIDRRFPYLWTAMTQPANDLPHYPGLKVCRHDSVRLAEQRFQRKTHRRHAFVIAADPAHPTSEHVIPDFSVQCSLHNRGLSTLYCPSFFYSAAGKLREQCYSPMSLPHQPLAASFSSRKPLVVCASVDRWCASLQKVRLSPMDSIPLRVAPSPSTVARFRSCLLAASHCLYSATRQKWPTIYRGGIRSPSDKHCIHETGIRRLQLETRYHSATSVRAKIEESGSRCPWNHASDVSSGRKLFTGSLRYIPLHPVMHRERVRTKPITWYVGYIWR